MNKRVHEIAKERGLATKDVLEQLKAAGVSVKSASSSVDEDAATRVLGNGGAPASAPKPAAPSKKQSAAGAGEKASRGEKAARDGGSASRKAPADRAQASTD